MMKFLTHFKISFRSRMSILMIGTVLAALSLVYTNRLADVLRQKEQNDVTLWVAAMERVSRDAFGTRGGSLFLEAQRWLRSVS